jgi:hypothetical protein
VGKKTRKISVWDKRTNEKIKTFHSMTETANKLNIPYCKIYQVCTNKIKSYQNYIFKYNDDIIYEFLKEELWKPIILFPNYEVSNFGRIRNIKRNNKILQQNYNGGYMYIQLSKNGIPKSFLYTG